MVYYIGEQLTEATAKYCVCFIVEVFWLRLWYNVLLTENDLWQSCVVISYRSSWVQCV